MAGEIVLKSDSPPAGGKQQVTYSVINQDQLVQIKEITDNINDIVDGRVYENVTSLLNTNSAIYADGKMGVPDPLNQVAGWHFKNGDNLAEKINWYFIANLNPQNDMTLDTLKFGYAVVTLRSATQIPFISLYTKPLGGGQDHTSWYRSRKNFATYSDHSAKVGNPALLYFGENDPLVHPTLPRIQLTYDASSSVGPMDFNEEILFGGLSTSTGFAKGTYDFVIEQLGYNNNRYRTDYLLTSNEAPEDPPAAGYTNTHYVTLDATNDYIDLDGTGNTLDYGSEWGIGIEIEDVSTINDSSFVVLARSGNNTITLRKGGSNWGIYCFNGSQSVVQANTWYAPQAGSKILVQCNGTKIEYYLDGTKRANMTMNSNKANSSHVVDELQIGKGGTSSAQGSLNYWYGGVNNLSVHNEFLGGEAVAEYFGGQDVTGMSFYDDQVVDFIPLGEQTYPAVAGIKAVATGELKNGTESDFVER